MSPCQLERDGATHRAAEHYRLFEAKSSYEGHDRLDVGFAGKEIFLFPPPFGRQRAAMVGQVKGKDAPAGSYLRVAEQVPVLAGVGPRSVQADERSVPASFLEVDAVAGAGNLDVDVPAGYGVELRHAHYPPA